MDPHHVFNLSSPPTHLLFVKFMSAISAVSVVKVLASDTAVLSVGIVLATALDLESSASPDPEVRSTGRVNNAVFYPSAIPKFRIRICHL